MRFTGNDFTAPERINVGTDPSGVPFWALSAPADGSLDFVGKGAHWFAPRDTFCRAGLLRINAKPPRSDVFYLHSDGHQKDTALAGISLDFVDRPGVLGLGYLRLSDSDAPIRRGAQCCEGMRQGDPAFDPGPRSVHGIRVCIRVQGGQPSHTGRCGIRRDRPCLAAAELETGPALPLHPLSGDDPSTRRNEAFDPLFYTYNFDRMWGAWIQGDITGMYLLINTNCRANMLQGLIHPADGLDLGMTYWHFAQDQPRVAGATARDLDEEIKLYVKWVATAALELGAPYGIFLPGEAAKQFYGGNRAYQLMEAYVWLSF